MWEKIKEFFEGSPENYADERTREVTNPDGKVGEEKEVRIPLTEETAAVDKGTVVVGEVIPGFHEQYRKTEEEVKRQPI
jgi:hypothetical protein